MEKKARVIAMYLPQYHPIPLNDEWWGPGFTEWTNVASAKPLFKGHYQPRIPADLGFYDLRLSETREKQADLAREAGIEGFMYWHYWFGKGKRLLERPFNEVLESGKPDFPFCLGWANHSWSKKTWTAVNSGNVKSQVLEQTYIPEEFIDHFYDVLPALKDPRYIKVDGKPFFLIYNVLGIPNANEFMECWQKLAKKNGLKGIHFVGNVMGHYMETKVEDILKSGVDAIVSCHLASARSKSIGKLAFYIKKIISSYSLGIQTYDYSSFARNYLTELEKQEYVYPSIFPQKDETPRRGKKSLILTNSTPEAFAILMRKTIEHIAGKADQHKIIMINAWNEWGEGSYLEPDLKFGRSYLNALKESITK